MSLETFLEGVRSELAVELNVTVVDGYIEGPVEQEMACVYPEASDEDQDDVQIEELVIYVRYFLPYTQQFTPESPSDTSDLIAIRDAIVTALKDKQTAQFGIWYFRVTGFTFNAPSRWVQARLRGYESNPYAP